MGIVRRISALSLVVTLALVGLPLPAQAGGEESPPITLNGRSLNPGPLSGLLHARLPEAVAAFLEQADGEISGVLQDADGKPLANQRVELDSSVRTGRLITTTSANGAFKYTGLGPGRYEVQHQMGGETVVRSGQLDLVAGEMQLTGITLIRLAEEKKGRSRGAKIAVIAGVAVGAAVLIAVAAACANTPRARPECGGQALPGPH